ncbi:MAG: ArsR/SmtB family transcription factor [Chloroflexota bacterium]
MHYHIYQAVGDTKRILILYALHEKPRYVTELKDLLNIPQSTVSRHLAILLDRGVVKKQRNGAAVVYSLADDRLIMVMDRMRGILKDILADTQ